MSSLEDIAKLRQQWAKVLDNPEFKVEAERLVKHFNISASAKYTLTPRDDFIGKIVYETIYILNKEHQS